MSAGSIRKFLIPEVVFGEGAIAHIGRHVANMGGGKVLLVTDEGVVRAGWALRAVESLSDAGIESLIFSDVVPNPRDSQCVAGAELYLRENCDVIVAVGGGSPMDCAKGIAILASNGGSIGEYVGVDLVRNPLPPLLCVPTTAGSSADVSQFSIISFPQEQLKKAIISKAFVPDVSIIDPDTLSTVDSSLSAETTMDALVHAIEAFVSNASSPITDMCALEAIRRIFPNIRRCPDVRVDSALRRELMLGSYFAGMAFSNASLGIVHSIAHTLGGTSDLPHGLCNAMILIHGIRVNFAACPEKFRQIAGAMGISDIPQEDSELLEVLCGQIQQAALSLGLCSTLSAMGVTGDMLEAMAAQALNDPCLVTNPARVDKEVILNVLRAIF